MPNIYEWLNKEKARYYKITIERNTVEYKLNYVWGGCNSNRGGKKSLIATTEEEVHHFINNMIKRRKSRGYELINHS